jgi:hypothetical protein
LSNFFASIISSGVAGRAPWRFKMASASFRDKDSFLAGAGIETITGRLVREEDLDNLFIIAPEILNSVIESLFVGQVHEPVLSDEAFFQSKNVLMRLPMGSIEP